MKAEHLCICSLTPCQCVTPHDAAPQYLAAGWSVVPVKVGEKRPALAAWKAYQARRPNPDEIAAWFSPGHLTNMALVTGKISNVTVVDTDSERAAAVVTATLDPGVVTPLVRTPRGQHFYFVYTPGLGTQAHVKGFELDVRNDGGIAVLPPSVGADGQSYTWLRGPHEPLQAMPAALKAILSDKRLPQEIVRGFAEGERNCGLFKLACKIHRLGYDEEGVLALLQTTNHLSRPPLAASELARIRRSALRCRSERKGVAGCSVTHSTEQRSASKVANRVLEITAGWQLFNAGGEAFADVDGDVVAINSSDVLERLAYAYFAQTNDVLAKDTLHAAQRILSAKAKLGDSRRLHNRAATIGSEVWVDLGNAAKEAVYLHGSRWEITNKPSMMFRPNPLNEAMFTPVRGGDARQLLDFMNLADPHQGPVLLAWVALTFLDIKYPPLFVLGDAKSGKSTLAKMFCRLVDPCNGDLMTPSRDRDDFVLNLSERRVSVFDNVKRLGGWESAVLCVAATGGSERRRAKYANREQVVLDIQGPVIIAALDLPTVAADLLDRAITIRINRLADTSMRDDEVFWQQFEAAAPKILGGLLDALAKSEELLCQVEDLPGVRMTSFARRGESVCRAMGYSPGVFHKALEGNLAAQSKELLFNSALGTALFALAENEGVWQGTMSDLLAVLATHVDSSEKKATGWPSAASSLGREIRKLLPLMSHAGISAEFGKSSNHHRTRLVTIRSQVGPSVRPVRLNPNQGLEVENPMPDEQWPLSGSDPCPVRQCSLDRERADVDRSTLPRTVNVIHAETPVGLAGTGRTDDAKCSKGVP